MSILQRHGLALCPLLATTLFISGCSNDVLDWRNAQVNNGKIYAGNANKPISGKVTNIPFTTAYGSQPGYRTLAGATGVLLTAIYGSPLVCDSRVEDGLLDGDIVCKLPQSEVVMSKGHFNKGAMSDSFEVYDEIGKNLALKTSFSNGLLDGDLKQYAPGTGQLISQHGLKKGLAEGIHKKWDQKTGNLLLEENYSHGHLDGDFLQKDANGQVMTKGSFHNDKFTGFEVISLKYNTGNGGPDIPLGRVEKRFQDGAVKNQEEVDSLSTLSGRITSCVDDKRSEVYHTTREFPPESESLPLVEKCRKEIEAGNKSPEPLIAVARPVAENYGRNDFPSESNACTAAWGTAFRNANGQDVPITYDQAWEFVDNCRAGKRP